MNTLMTVSLFETEINIAAYVYSQVSSISGHIPVLVPSVIYLQGWNKLH
jgi:hypothetical protein